MESKVDEHSMAPPAPGVLDHIFFALSSAKRRSMVEKLSLGSLTIGELQQQVGTTQATASKQ